MKKYTFKFPPDMNKKSFKKLLREDEEYLEIPLEGRFKGKLKDDQTK